MPVLHVAEVAEDLADGHHLPLESDEVDVAVLALRELEVDGVVAHGEASGESQDHAARVAEVDDRARLDHEVAVQAESGVECRAAEPGGDGSPCLDSTGRGRRRSPRRGPQTAHVAHDDPLEVDLAEPHGGGGLHVGDVGAGEVEERGRVGVGGDHVGARDHRLELLDVVEVAAGRAVGGEHALGVDDGERRPAHAHEVGGALADVAVQVARGRGRRRAGSCRRA